MPLLEHKIQMAREGKREKLGGSSFQAHWKEYSRGKLIATTWLSALDEMLSGCNLGHVSFWGSTVKGIHDSSSSLEEGRRIGKCHMHIPICSCSTALIEMQFRKFESTI